MTREICESCEEPIEDEVYHGDHSTHYESKALCETCYYEDEPCATILYGDDDSPRIISDTRDETEGDFKVKWHATDAWRGHYKVESDNYRLIHTDCILSYSKDAQELEQFDEELRKTLTERGVRYVRVFTRTSNVFSSGYDFFVHKDDFERAEDVMAVLATAYQLRLRYRDSERFTMTALTGKDEFDEKDKLLVRAYERIEEGATFDEVKEELLDELDA